MERFSLRAIIERKLQKTGYSLINDETARSSSPTSFHSETTLGSDEKQEQMIRVRSGFGFLATWKQPLLFMVCAIVSSALTFLSMRTTHAICGMGRYHQQLMKTPVPELPKEIRIFDFNQTFVDPPTPENNRAWNDLLPFGRGYVFVENGSEYGLEPGITTDHGEIYSIAMYHQLHCLGLVRRNYWRLMEGVLTQNASVIHEAHRQNLNSHTGHCFDYFRQSFECAADMSLEWPRTEADGRRFQVDGKGIPHVCTSKRALKEYMDLHHFNASHNHDIAA